MAQFHLLIATELNERFTSSLLPVMVALAPFKAAIALFIGETALTAYYNFGTCFTPLPNYTTLSAI